MKFVSPLLKRAVYPLLHRSGYFSRYADAGTLSVVTYHGVLPAGYKVSDTLLDGGWVTADSFRGQLGLLRSRYNVVAPELVRRWCKGEAALPERAVLLTCDDGMANAVIEMLPILQAEKVPCLFFVTAESLSKSPAMLWYEELYLTLLAAPEGPLDGHFSGVPVKGILSNSVRQRHRFWWTLVATASQCEAESRLGIAKALRAHFKMAPDWSLQYLDRQAARFRLLLPNEIRCLLAGGMAIGSHTTSHPKLSQLPAGLACKEISESRCQLEKSLATPVWSIAYPFGGVDSVSSRELQMVENAGYDCAFTNFGGGFVPAISRFDIPRMHVTFDMSLAEFEAHLSGFHENLRRRFGNVEKIPLAPAPENSVGSAPCD
jgi:peptidoglycan/xylan/chitin deacetylase (PgdA/CDA1 family)